MTFNATLPTDSNPIRTLGSVIRPNWEAIEEANSSFRPYAINYQDRTPLGVSNDPAAIASTSIVYVKQDASGDPELYTIDASSNIVQLVDAGYLGGPTTNLKVNNIRFGTATVDYARGNVVSAYCQWDNTGTLQANSFGISSVTRPAAGIYEITLSTARSNNLYVPMPVIIGATSKFSSTAIISSTVFRVYQWTDAGVASNNAGAVIVAGGF